MEKTLAAYLSVLDGLCRSTEVRDGSGEALSAAEGIERFRRLSRRTHDAGDKLMFIGNGGSAGIASHSAIDYMKNGGMRSQVFTDGAALTCLGNDLGYENVFARQIEFHARPGDLLIAVSSSGNSPNIIKAAHAARAAGCAVATFSGFRPDNTLRSLGDVNFYIPSMEYGFVELGHQILLHAALDLEMGWRPAADMSEISANQEETKR
jgi:D-sedoheptulose 7-phosphate isomerase